MTSDEIINEIEKLDKHEREKLLRLLTGRFISEYIPLNSDWWSEKDNIYDVELPGDPNNEMAPSDE